jgi:hypothetical protein
MLGTFQESVEDVMEVAEQASGFSAGKLRLKGSSERMLNQESAVEVEDPGSPCLTFF